VADRVRPVVLAREHTLPLAASLTQLFPDGVLRRGITITVDGPGAASVALTLAAAPVHTGSWVAFVDLPELNLAAAAEAGVVLERVACIRSGGQWSATVAALLGAFDLVIVGMGRRVRAGDVRRLGARARERGSVLVALRGVCGAAVWPDAPDVTLTTGASQWSGLGAGHGHLRARMLTVRAEGRRGFSRPCRIDLVLPAEAQPEEQPALVSVAPVRTPPAPVVAVPVIARAG